MRGWVFLRVRISVESFYVWLSCFTCEDISLSCFMKRKVQVVDQFLLSA